MLRAATSRLAVRAAGLRALSAQAPTVAKTETKTWSEHQVKAIFSHRSWFAHAHCAPQADRKGQMVGPRFKSADLSAQVRFHFCLLFLTGFHFSFPLSSLIRQPLPVPAIDLIAQAPIHKTTKRVVSCDGGARLFRANSLLNSFFHSRRRSPWPSAHLHQLGTLF